MTEVPEDLLEEVRETRGIKSMRQSRDESLISEWLSLIHFPDDTRVNLTKRGRLFVFQTPKAPSFSALISPATWSRYRSNTDMTIPMSMIRMALEDKDLFVSSFTVTSVGSQKAQLQIRLPIKVQEPGLIRLVALMCLTRGLISSGTYQSDREDKTAALVEAFEDAFGVRLSTGENKRGFYIKVTKPIVTAVCRAITGTDEPSVPEIIRAIGDFQEESILTYLSTWFSYSRIYRSPDDKCLFMFRAGEETQEITQLLDKIGVKYEDGSITDADTFVPVYIVIKTEENETLLSALPFIDSEKSKRALLQEVAKLRVRLKSRDEKVRILEEIINDLQKKLQELQEKKDSAMWSRYYYEKQTTDLRGKLGALKRVRDELEGEVQILKNALADEKPAISGEAVQIPVRSISQADEIVWLKKRLAELETRMEEGAHTPKEVVFRQQEVRISGTDPSEFSSQGFVVPLGKKGEDLLQALLGVEENWILLLLAAEENMTLEELAFTLDSRNPAELRRTLRRLEEDLKIIDRIDDDRFAINYAQARIIFDEQLERVGRLDNIEIRSLLKQIPQLRRARRNR
ncbi:MAG: hypothetical protein ACXAB4_04170 [Candidatus Hodarchaeales archaeon]|jgi:hypothetical protein